MKLKPAHKNNMKTNKLAVLLALAAFSMAAQAQTDHLMARCQDQFLSPGGEGPDGEEGRMLKLRYWNMPPTVAPGAHVKSRLVWTTLSANRTAVFFATVVGIWHRDKPLARPYRGMLGEAGKEVEVAFEFTAPTRPGRYRIRWILPMAFKPITNFYSKEDGGANDPGNAWWSEVTFNVSAA